MTDAQPPRTSHRLRVNRLALVGGGRDVSLSAGVNIIQGPITTGKSTFVRLLRSLLATVPDALPPETEWITALRGEVLIAEREWGIYRELTTNRNAPVEVATLDSEDDGEPPLRVPVTGVEASFSRFMLDRLHIPAVTVPRARTEPTGAQTPVTMTDWLGYCIVTGDELDSQVFGHLDAFRNQKRRWVFELAYGFYDVGTAELAAALRSLDLRLEALDRDAEVIGKFLADTPFADSALLEFAKQEAHVALDEARAAEKSLANEGSVLADVSDLRESVLRLGRERDEQGLVVERIARQIAELRDLGKQLRSQSARITRALVAGEWFVDFDFQLCPRCGTGLEQHRGSEGTCYLCLQPEPEQPAAAVLEAEQDRITAQIVETTTLIDLRQAELASADEHFEHMQQQLHELSRDLDHRTSTFLSEQMSAVRERAAHIGRLEENLRRLDEYGQLLGRHRDVAATRAAIIEQREELVATIERRTVSQTAADDNVKALERRMLEYLDQLHIPQLGDLLTVEIDRTSFLPQVSGRSFDQLSSQGLKTLVNAAHALAHHTVAIDRDLPIPGFLVLDGLSANVGHEGFDAERVADLYRLLIQVGETYGDHLQIIAVDNDLPSAIPELAERVVLALSQEDRLIHPLPEGGAQPPPDQAE